jgi:hypothetical protein
VIFDFVSPGARHLVAIFLVGLMPNLSFDPVNQWCGLVVVRASVLARFGDLYLLSNPLLRPGVIDYWPWEYLSPRRTFTEEIAQVPHRALSTHRLRDALMAGRNRFGTGRGGACCLLGRCLLVAGPADSTALTLPDVDALAPRMLDIAPIPVSAVLPRPGRQGLETLRIWMTTIGG